MSQIQVDNIYNKEATGSPNFPLGANVTGVITATSFSGSGANLTGIDATALKDSNGTVRVQANTTGAVITGNVSVGGTLTYEDVTNVDAVGLITARQGIKVTGGDIQVGTATTIDNSGVNVTGVVTATSFSGSGASLTGIDAAPTVELVASGTLATDDAVFFNVSGTVSKVVVTAVSDAVGSSVDARGGVSNSVSQWEFDSCRISDTTFAICWEKDGIKVVVGTISGTSISFGTILNTGNGTSSGNDFPLIDYCAKSGCIALAYKNGSNLSMRAIGVSGNTLTEGAQATKSVNFGTNFALACGNSRYGAAGPMTGGLVFGRGSSSTATYILDFTISGTTLTLGSSQTEVNKQNNVSNVFRSSGLIYCPLRDGYVLTYVDETWSNQIYLWMDSLTRNTNNAAPTYRDNGGPLAAASMSTTVCSLAYDSEYQNIAGAYNDNNNHTAVRKINFQSNYNLADYNPVTLESGSTAVINWLSLVYQREIGAFFCLGNNTTNGRVDLFKIGTNANGEDLTYNSSTDRTNSIVSYATDKITLAAVGYGKVVTTIPSSNNYQVNSTVRQYAHDSQNVTPSTSNFLGFSAGNYTDGQTAKIKIVGNTTTQTGLSAMSTYYITGIGTVSSTEGSPSIKAGYAINTTTMIITPQYIY